MVRSPLILAWVVLGAASSAQAVDDGPVTITGHVASNTLISGRLFGVPVGAPVTMTFTTKKGGFNPFWGPTGHFCNINEVSFELHAGAEPDVRINYSAANNTSLLFVNAGFVTPAVSQCVFELFQMTLDTPGYSVYFKAQDLNNTVGWTTPLVCGLPAVTPASAFAFATAPPEGSCTSTTPTPSRACWYVRQQTQGPVTPAPEMTIRFDGTLSVGTSAACRADFNEDGTVTVADIFAFLTAWFGGCSGSPACDGRYSDFNCSNTITVADIFAFLTAWFEGCD